MDDGSLYFIILSCIVFWGGAFVFDWIERQIEKNSAIRARISETTFGFIGAFSVSFIFSFLLLANSPASTGKRESAGGGSIFPVCLVPVLIFLFAAFGTGTMEADKPEGEQMRERGAVAIGAILGFFIGGGVGALV